MNGEAVVTWSFENWVTVGLMTLISFLAFHFVMTRLRANGGE